MSNLRLSLEFINHRKWGLEFGGRLKEYIRTVSRRGLYSLVGSVGEQVNNVLLISLNDPATESCPHVDTGES